uniref:Alpha-carbonic anhydrase domain-containing protein n=1 Tax=Monodelphis domestica TaxID=13616 RepID=F7CPH5_MONDO
MQRNIDFLFVSFFLPGKGEVNQKEWPTYFRSCGGEEQSPIDIQTDKVTVDTSLKPLQLKNFGLQHGKFPMSNTGHTATVQLPDNMKIYDGQSSFYTAVQFHLHWEGETAKPSGSEHTMNGMHSNAELHVVAFDCSKYPTYDVAKTKPDGLLVLAILIKWPNSSPFLSLLGQSTNLTSLNLKGMMPPNTVNMFTYNGSLTTPPCTQNVRWMIFANLATISTNQVNSHSPAIILDALLKSALQIINNSFSCSHLSSTSLGCLFHSINQKTFITHLPCAKHWEYQGRQDQPLLSHHLTECQANNKGLLANRCPQGTYSLLSEWLREISKIVLMGTKGCLVTF